MKTFYFREMRRYTPSDIALKIGIDEEETKEIITKLIVNNIIKKVRDNDKEDESEDDQTARDNDNNLTKDSGRNSQKKDREYFFRYVGVIVLGKYTFICYPKYISSTTEPLNEMKQVLKVIEKYKKQKKEIGFASDEEENQESDVLGNILFLLKDYMEYNIYTNQVEIIELNGQGETNWDITINETYPFISKDGRPYYLDLHTHHSIDDDRDYFQRLHMCILTRCSNRLQKAQLNELFDLDRIRLYDGDLEEFGEIDYILYRLNNELGVQFNSRKQNLLKAMHRYLREQYKASDDFKFTLYGTGYFHTIWEKVCAQAFNNQLATKLKDLPISLNEDYNNRNNDSLIKLIERPIWKAIEEGIVIDSKEGRRTLQPDLISLYKYKDQWCFGIFDAKYYDIQLGKEKFYNRPGIEDITKQYLYQLVYQEYILKHDFTYIENAFLVPSEKDKFEVIGEVEMKIFHELTETKLKDIAVIKSPARILYDLYLDDKKIKNLVSGIKSIPMRIEKSQLSKNVYSIEYFI